MKLSHNKSEANFRRFEVLIDQFLMSYPAEIRIPHETLGLEPTTVAARLRDAIASYQTYHWKSYINRAKFLELRDQLAVVMNNRGVFLVDHETYRKTSREGAAPQVNSEIPTIDLAGLDPESITKALDAAAHLCHLRLLPGGILIRNAPKSIIDLTERYDVAVSTSGTNNGTYLLV